MLLLIARFVGRSEVGLMAVHGCTKAVDRWFISGVETLEKFTA